MLGGLFAPGQREEASMRRHLQMCHKPATSVEPNTASELQLLKAETHLFILKTHV